MAVEASAEVMRSLRTALESDAPKLVLVHDNADGDAVASAVALQDAYAGITIGCYEAPSALGKRMLSGLGVQCIENPEPSAFSAVIIVDTSGPSHLSGAPPITAPFVVDHHESTSRWEGSKMVLDVRATSCSEVVYELLRTFERTPSKRACLALLCGILADTGHFRYARAETLRNAGTLMQIHDLQVEEALELLESEEYFNISRRLAGLKSIQRSKFQNFGDCIIAVSQISSFESWACKLLLIAGADVSFVGSQHRSEFRVSCRAKSSMVARGFNAGKLLEAVAVEMGGNGGGHDAAAGLNGEGDVEAMLNVCMTRTIEAIKALPPAAEKPPAPPA